MFQNKFRGSIPESLGHLEKLGEYLALLLAELRMALSYSKTYRPEVLFLSSNQLEGGLEPLFGGMQDSLEGLYLSENEFVGTLPMKLCDMVHLSKYMLLISKPL